MRSEEGRLGMLFGGTGDKEELDALPGFGNVEGELVDVWWNVGLLELGGDRSYRRTHAGGLTALTRRDRAGCEVAALCSGFPRQELEAGWWWHGAQGIMWENDCSGRVKVRYPNVGGEEPKKDQIPGISEAKGSEKVDWRMGKVELKKGAEANSRMQDECEDDFALLQGVASLF